MRNFVLRTKIAERLERWKIVKNLAPSGRSTEEKIAKVKEVELENHHSSWRGIKYKFVRWPRSFGNLDVQHVAERLWAWCIAKILIP